MGLARFNVFVGGSSSPPQPVPPEPTKHIVTDNPVAIIVWHRWTLMAGAASMALLYLNFTEFAIGGELGPAHTASQTANILGALQLVIKVHELVVVASLTSIARQWIHRTLLDHNTGTLLSLVGAECALSQPSFIISKEYFAAVAYGISARFWRNVERTSQESARRREMFLLVLFLFFGCVVSSLAGPASGVLMIPRVDWFFEKNLTLPTTSKYPAATHYPSILIPPEYANGTYDWGNTGDPFTGEGYGQVDRLLESWMFYTMRRTLFLAVRRKNMVHKYEDRWGEVTLNTSTTWNRTLGGDWTGGGTTIKSIMRNSVLSITSVLLSRGHETAESEAYEAALTKWTSRKYIGSAGAIEVKVECHFRPMIPCIPADPQHWCYTSTKRDTKLKSSRDLLLIDKGALPAQSQPFVYMTEGQKSKSDPKFVTSMEVVLSQKTTPRFSSSPEYIFDEKKMFLTPGLIVCSISANIISATVTSFDIMFTGQYAEYAEDNSQPVLFHENWLEGISNISQTDPRFGKSMNATGNGTFSVQHSTSLVRNPTLLQFARTLIEPYERRMYNDSWNWMVVEAAELEVVLGGAFASILLYLPPVTSQYVLPPSLQMPNQRYYTAPTNFTLEVYNQGYGFRLSSRTGILGMIVLLFHGVIVLFGSLWQLFRWRRVIKAWRSVPEYLALGIESSEDQPELLNTCVGITGKHTLQTVVRIEERVTGHLQVYAVDREDLASGYTTAAPSSPILSRFGNNYG